MNDLISRQSAIDAICEHGTDLERRGITVLAVANYKQATIDLLESLPSVQPQPCQNHTQKAPESDTFGVKTGETCSDTISRKAAIDALDVGAEVLRRVLDEVDVVGVERAKYEWGLGLIESYIADVNDLPSVQPECTEQDMREQFNAGYACGMHAAQPESKREWYMKGYRDAQANIVQCEDCKWRRNQNGTMAWIPCRALVTPDDFYCKYAERKEQ